MRARQRRRGRRLFLGQTARGRGQTAVAKSVVCGEGVYRIHTSVQELNDHLPPSTSRAAGFFTPTWDFFSFFFLSFFKADIMNIIKMDTLHHLAPFPVAGGGTSVRIDRGGKTFLNSYGIVCLFK